MDNDPSILDITIDTPLSISTTTDDPIQAWIDILLNHGGHFILLGIPAIFATVAFLYRIRWLKQHRQPHSYGRTSLIYWPTTMLVVFANTVLVYLIIRGVGSDIPNTRGLLSGARLLFVAWCIGLDLNTNEHRYEIRSSDYMFVYYLVTLVTSLLSLCILQRDQRALQESQCLGCFILLIALAFIIEAFPRTNTRVQVESREKEHLNAYDQANLCSRWTYHYMQGIVALGAKRPLTPEDIKDTEPAEIKTHVNYEAVSAAWNGAVVKAKASNKTPSLMLSVFRAYQGQIALQMMIRLSGHGFIYLSPIFFAKLLHFFVDYHAAMSEGRQPPPLQYGFLIASAMLLSNIVSTLLINKSMEKTTLLGARARAAVIAMIYRKSLKLSPQARQKSTVGEITNHMAVDAQKWLMASNFMPLILTVPFELAIGTYLLYRTLGWSLIAGLVVFAIITPIQGKMAGFMNDFEGEKLEKMDARLRLMTEILSNIKIVKLYGWEDAFREKVDAIRSQELHAQKLLTTINALLTIVFSSVTLLMALATFTLFATVGGPNMTPGKITSEVIFVSIALFGLLNKPLGLLSHMISQTIAVKVSCNRVQGFLLLEEIDGSTVQRYSRQPPSSPSKKGRRTEALAIDIEHGTFAWEKEADPVLAESSGKDVHPDDERQPLLSGSSSSPATPLRPVLSDISLQIPEGNLTAIVGRIGQGKSSLLSAIMGEMYKKQGTVKVYGDLAYVPQQAWIINATLKDNILFGKEFNQELYDRIVYASGLRPDLEMLPAGDQTEIGEKGINLSGGQKQRVSLARAAYQDADVYLLDDPLSAVDAHVDQHLWQNLIGPNGLLKHKTRVLVTHGIHHLEHVDQIVVFKDGLISETGEYEKLMKARDAFYQLIKDYSVVKKGKHNNGDSKADDDSEINTIVEQEAEAEKDEDDEDEDGALISDEKMEHGKIGWKIIKIYARAVEVVCGIRAAKTLHDVLLTRVLRLPMSFFDTTPMGRIVNRFSSDIGAIDGQLPEEFNDLFAFISIIGGTLFVIAYSTPIFLLMIPPLAFTYYIIQDYFIKTSGALNRLNSIAKSPLLQQFSETISGVSTIRVMKGLSDQFIRQNEARSDAILNRVNMFMLMNRWLQVRLEFLGAFTVFAAAVFAVWNADKLDPSLVGLALSYALNMIGFINYLVRTVSEVQNLLVSVERVHEYSTKPTEAPAVTGVRLPESWPQQGRVVFKDYSTRYREGLDLVIKDVSFSVEPAQKIGIVGRTGAGKSSLTLALFRIIEAADSYWAVASDPSASDAPLIESELCVHGDGGSIEIDGIDISTLGLKDLRRHLAIIPQDPTLFAGTLRSNLDPFNESSDTDLWQALERAHLKDHVSTLTGGLSFEVSQNGENFSVGQRSLICLARALLRKTKVLVLDEATAAVDVETDDLIQKTIRKEFKDRTILTIAHRIKTVMDSDKILVLEKGRVQEFDAPLILLKRKDSLFHSLAQQAGEI
ncbi:hypothetical protein BGX28_003401 [Mortierella sp. GBA30]|nr:hypothetical protein BGX28_003401 [Mortierella sp. GBA30]